MCSFLDWVEASGRKWAKSVRTFDDGQEVTYIEKNNICACRKSSLRLNQSLALFLAVNVGEVDRNGHGV